MSVAQADAPESRLHIWQGDITTLAFDAIVNAANSSLLGGGGVDGAIHRAAGPQLRQYCANLGGCPTGEARITPGFRLPARHVLHTVGPVWRGGSHGEPGLLAACFRACLALANQHQLNTVAFPAISCGIYGYPPELAAPIAVEESLTALACRDKLQITLVAFDTEMVEHFATALSGQRGAQGQKR